MGFSGAEIIFRPTVSQRLWRDPVRGSFLQVVREIRYTRRARRFLPSIVSSGHAARVAGHSCGPQIFEVVTSSKYFR